MSPNTISPKLLVHSLSSCREPTNRRRGLLARLACAAALSAFAVASRAAVVTERFDFTATGFGPLFGGGAVPPITAASGSFTVTFDTTSQVLDKTGVIVNSWSPVLSDSPVAYSYLLDGSLNIGGIASAGVLGLHNFGISDRDFALKLTNVTSTPTFSEMLYMVPGNDTLFNTHTGSVTMTLVPEPASLALLAMVFASRWRSSCEDKREQKRDIPRRPSRMETCAGTPWGFWRLCRL